MLDYSNLRKQLLEQRKRLSTSDINKNSAAMIAVFDHWFNQSQFCAQPCHITAFLPIREEPDLRPLLKELSDKGHHISLPVIIDSHQPLSFYEWQTDEPLVAARFGTLEPARTRAAQAPNIMLTPMLAYGPHGERMGYGGGFYDRTISQFRRVAQQPLVIGVTWSELQLPENYIAQDHDEPLDAVLTEKELRFFA